METKVCTTCKIEKPIEQFLWKNKEKGIRHYPCSECYKEIRKKSYEKNKEYYLNKNRKRKETNNDWYNEFKKGKKCHFCDESEPVCLDFHHLDGTTKEYNIGSMGYSTYSIDTIMKEVEKCVILCSNCHRKVHANILKLSP
jgi:hypothetical protein